jgi:hypothetical protein
MVEPLGGGTSLQVTREVRVTEHSPLANTKTVTVTVTWRSGAKTSMVPLQTVLRP